ncbi:MAG: MFS transporter, partial [Treponema sp.]|nr:MFS transporter [Treponema sp.]
AAATGTEARLSFGQQVRMLFTDKYMVLMYIYFLLYTVGTTMKNLGLVYYSNYVLGTYNDGMTQMLISVIGGIPMGIGIFAVWPLAKRFGKRNVTMFGFALYAAGGLICWLFPTQLVLVLAGQFIKNIGGLPCAYVFMALFADCLDHLEWKTGRRIDGAAMSVYNIIAVAMVGIMTGVFNWMLSATGYIAPVTAQSTADAASKLAENGWIPQLALDTLKPAADGILTVAMQQPDSVNRAITFAFVGIEVLTAAALIVILFFLTVEKHIAKEQEEIKARKESNQTEEGNI